MTRSRGKHRRSPFNAGATVQNLSYSFAALDTDEPSPAAPAATGHRLIVGMDYGTTASGICYVPSSMTAADIEIIQSFPGPAREAEQVWKVPSRIAYAAENPVISVDAWGYRVHPGLKSYSWTKLLLDKSTAVQVHDDPSLSMTEGAGFLQLPFYKTATETVADYLRGLYKHFIEKVESNFTADVVRVTPFEFWFTVPAIWSDSAKNATLTAAKMAGFGGRPGDVINIIPEPEAAAIDALHTYTKEGSLGQIHCGSGVLICDCGGGTVDITTYRVTKTTPLEFEELAVGTGAKCGSTYIDREFHTWMANKFGEDFTSLGISKIGPGSKFMREFEAHKKDLDDDVDDASIHTATLFMYGEARYSPHFDDTEMQVKFSGRDLKSFFEPALEKIFELLGSQLHVVQAGGARINHCVLVGGFGESRYLRKRVEEWRATKGNILVVTPQRCQAAIMRGAAIRGLEHIKPKSRKCRRHYGLHVNPVFVPGVHPSTRKVWDPYGEVWRCDNYITWVIDKGSAIDETTCVKQPVSVRLEDGYWEGLKRERWLYSCASEDPPDYVDNFGIEKTGRIEFQLHRSDLQHFQYKWISGKKYWNLEYTYVVSMGAEQGVLLCKVVANDREIGRTTIRYGDQPDQGVGS